MGTIDEDMSPLLHKPHLSFGRPACLSRSGTEFSHEDFNMLDQAQ